MEEGVDENDGPKDDNDDSDALDDESYESESEESESSMSEGAKERSEIAKKLKVKMDMYEGYFEPMEEFSSLPSMYTKEKWEELKKTHRGKLAFDNLYWLSRYDPKPNDGHLLERIIDQKIEKSKGTLEVKLDPLPTTVAKLAFRCQELES